ncbi:MAG TPA: hypothetical protein DEQ87_14070 [Algoriphagus sp.]|jgi:hypothetical protein|uniref:DUF4221 family protein n=1 Tax=unclassified Algoriphagus TaxID=2641541 RepID=UPI000C6998D3|nr:MULTISPECIES: DUF4221 family protein [unclassified Algoriphagus]MAL13553.1 hypothetical protein [Algoriphagus sp.]HAH35214.1 hypothetical protein [Algoriphagus sp.]HAS59770.1 hypothetical protein [Algoriphagus sp.]HCD88746.1 hypothetical protein [Algoriphagus sp.]|tara:strand:- start:891 stop:1955 length:1065 start_codon:yes stop_codon:yes gene_type:complete
MKNYLIFFFILLFSCKQNNQISLTDFEIEKADYFDIPIDDSTSNSPSVYHQSYNGDYIFYNIHTKSLDFFKNEFGLNNRIYLPFEGPNLIRKFLGFQILNDRIFIADLGRIVEIDFEGNIIADIGNLKNSTGFLVSPSFFGSNKSFLKENVLYFTAFDYMALTKDLLNGPFIYSLDLSSFDLKEVAEYPGFNLNSISNDYFFHNNIIIQDKILIFNYSARDVYLNDTRSRKWKKIEVLSKGHFDIHEFKGDKTNNNDSKKHFFQNGIYRTLIFDEHKNMYYRIYSYPDGDEKSKKRRTRLMILNSSLELIQEIDLPNFLTHIGAHITNGGLYLIDGNFSKEQENKIRFVKVYPH